MIYSNPFKGTIYNPGPLILSAFSEGGEYYDMPKM